MPSRLHPFFFDAVLGDPSLRLRRPGIRVQWEVKIPNMQQPIQTNRERIPKFYLYKMTVDNGSAPCVQDGVLTLAICKQTIRRVAPEGSVIIAFAGDCNARRRYPASSQGQRSSPVQATLRAISAERLTAFTTLALAGWGDARFRENRGFIGVAEAEG